MRTDSFHIEAMDCIAEEQVIRKRLERVPEVSGLDFDLVNRILKVEHGFESDEPVRSALGEIGLSPDDDCGTACAKPGSSATKENWLLGASLVLAIVAEVVAWSTGNERSWPVAGLALASIALGGKETFHKGWIALKTFTLNINFLMSLAVIGAIAIGSWPEAAMVTVLFAIAERIESYSLDRARNAVRSLMELAPETALVQDASGKWVEVPASTVSEGAIVRVKPGERIPLDGEVVNGSSAVNQAPITGESVPVDKAIGDQLFAGTINEQGVLEFRVTGTRGSTTLDRIVRTVQEAQGSRAPTQRFVDSFARVYTPIVVVLAVAVAVVPPLFGQPFLPWLYKALVMLVIACPCALVISTPVTVVSGLAAAARQGILIKGGAHLESGRTVRMIALDKTGTLTRGEPEVVEVVTLHDNNRDEALKIAASLDEHSQHPVAKAVVAAWNGETVPVEAFESLTGRGVTGKIEGTTYLLGNHRLMEERKVCCDHVHEILEGLEAKGVTAIVLADEKEALAVIGVADAVRSESVEAVKEMHALGLRVAMLTGDNQRTAETIGKQVGIDDVRAELLPENKLTIVEELLSAGGGVAMVGDGVNDAPALAKATVGVAMGAAGTDVALETADVALMKDDLRKLPVYIRLSRLTGSVLSQNIALALGIKVVFFALAFTGHATLWMAVFADMGASLLVVGNGLRLLRRTS